ncbi:hypothetical protein HHI36_002022 [Cryptolaemus montrouzieri]|uniref:DDE Tnp4 domain-containing protein n=1 Tax=Cryptolaemus montrouzieri TaxID=559131 RepID=A0ABD2P976_9CUCU
MIGDLLIDHIRKNPNVPKAVVIVDGTYSYIEKSGNYRTLRQSYSVHKGRHLFKALLVATNGFNLDVQGPYIVDGRNNDAAILKNELNQNINDVRNWFRDGDIFIVDRKYRDVLPYLDELNLISKLPASLAANQRHLKTEEENQAIAHVFDLKYFYLITGVLINKYHEPIITDGKLQN